jgi:hypothetical protein
LSLELRLEIAFKTSEDGQRNQEDNRHETEQGSIQVEVRRHGPRGQNMQNRMWNLSRIHVRTDVKDALKGHDDERDWIQEIDPSDSVSVQSQRNRILVRVHHR